MPLFPSSVEIRDEFVFYLISSILICSWSAYIDFILRPDKE